MNKRLIVGVLCLLGAGVQLGLGQTPGTAVPPGDSTTPATSAPANPGDLEQLREKIVQQEEQIKKLQESVQAQQKLLEQSLAAAKAAAAQQAAGTTTDGAKAAGFGNAAQPNLVPVVNNGNGRGAGQHPETQVPSPLSISLGNTTLTPLGFLDATFFARSTNVGSGIGTNFLAIPYNNVAGGHLSETSFSAQNSRLGFRLDSNFLGAKVLGYFESDFLFNNDAPSQQITSNSVGFRLRNFFVDVQKDNFEILGGQDWSLLTPNRVGLSPLPSDIFFTQDMDTNYQLGLTWTRAPQFRFIAHPNDNVAVGIALENPQQYIGGGSGASTVTLPANLNSSLSTQFQSGQSATAIPNWFPDIITKTAFDWDASGKHEHIEVAGLVRGFKDYVTSTTAPALPGGHTAIGYGGSLNSNFELFKGFHVIENFFASDGGGRYIFGTVPDVVVRPDGSISPIHAYSTVDGFEAQAGKNTLVYVYYGGVYAGQNVVFDPTAPGSTLEKPVYVGYGYAKSGQVRYGQELTGGVVRTFWKNPNYGALSLITQYSYVFKEPWSIATVGGPSQAHSNLIYVDLRYTLP